MHRRGRAKERRARRGLPYAESLVLGRCGGVERRPGVDDQYFGAGGDSFALLLGWESVLRSWKQALGGTLTAVQRGVRRPGSAVRRTRISGGARWQHTLLAQDGGWGDRAGDAPPAGRQHQAVQGGFHHSLRRRSNYRLQALTLCRAKDRLDRK